MTFYDADNPEYVQACYIIERLEDIGETHTFATLLISVVANYPNVRSHIINEYGSILEEE